MQRFFRLTFVTVLAAAVSACSVSGQQAAPAAPVAAGSPVFSPARFSSKLIFVVPMQGVRTSTGLVLADAIAATLRDAGQPAILSSRFNEIGPSISGRIVTQEERGSVVWVTASWELLAPYGTAVAEYRQQVVVDKRQWSQGSAEAINLLIADAGPRIAKMVNDYVSPTAMTTDLPIADPLPVAPPPPTSPPIAPLVPAPPPALPPVLPPQGETQALPGKPVVKAGKTVTATLGHRKKSPSLSLKSAGKGAKKPPRKRPILRPVPEDAPPAAASRPRRMALKMPKPRKPKNAKKKILMPVPESGQGRVNTDPPPVSWNRPSFLIKLVEGAPGDGNVALTKAMKAALRKRDITVTEDPRQAGYVIRGKVEISVPVGGRQQAKIVWVVNTMGGDEVGKAVQENAVKAGSLDGTWGRVADIVSNAAVSGIRELFGVEDKSSSKRSSGPKFSGGPALPQVPGRAVPPP